MNFDFTTIIFLLFVLMTLQPLLMGRWFSLRRAQAIRAIESAHKTRVITMIHRQERRSLFGLNVARHIDLEDAQTIIAAIKDAQSKVAAKQAEEMRKLTDSLGLPADMKLPF